MEYSIDEKGGFKMKNEKSWRTRMFIVGMKVLITLVVVVTITLIAVTGVYVPKTYKNVYENDYYMNYDDIRSQVVAFGLLAPSSHNMQSWRVVYDKSNENKMDVYLDSDRTLSVVDSNYNQLIISVGTFIAYIEKGAEGLGYKADVEYFKDGVLPDSPSIEEIQNTVIASVTLTKEGEFASEHLDSIGGSTKRLPYLDTELSDDVMNKLVSLNDFTNLDFNIISEENELTLLKDILISGVDVESKHEAAMMETSEVMRYTTYQKNKNPYGLSLHSDNPSVFSRTITEFLATVFKQPWEKDGEFWYQRDSQNIEQTNYFGMILSNTNTRFDQINIGLLYGKISLFVQSNNLDIQPTHQVLQDYTEMAELNRQINDNFSDNEHSIQMIFRIGETDVSIPVGLRFDVENIIE